VIGGAQRDVFEVDEDGDLLIVLRMRRSHMK
jgi:hypothetical protein